MASTSTQEPSAVGPAGNLLFNLNGRWSTIPDWAKCYLDLGRLAVNLKRESSRVVIGVTVPSREFASAFVSLGAVEANCRNEDGVSADNFELLSKLSQGDKVTVLIAKKKYKATFFNTSTDPLNEGIWVTFDNDGLKQFVPRSQCHRVSIGALGKSSLPKRTGLGVRKARTPDESFVRDVIGIESATDFAIRDNFTALIIGPVNALRYELEEEEFAVKVGPDKYATGHIEDLIRTKKFANDVEGEAFRTEVMADRAYQLDPELVRLDPPVVIFDGGAAFEKHHHEWESASWVVVLDRSSKATQDAASILNQYFVSKRISDEDPSARLPLPAGVELLSFLVPRRR